MIPVTERQRACWRTSSYSGSQGGNCVEVGPFETHIGVRDTKARERGSLAMSTDAWRAFVAGVKRDSVQ